ncbi:MAG: PAS domain-containing protein [Desulfobacula sp.]|nr:PAS domain-containing protein [Desulfobacula sp.]
MRIEKLEKKELMLNQALAFGKSALWHWEGNDKKFYLSASYYQMLGFLPYESLSKNPGLIDHIHPDDRLKTEAAFHSSSISFSRKEKSLLYFKPNL